MGIIKEFIQYKNARKLMTKFNKIKASSWKFRIIEEREYGRIKKKVKITIPMMFWHSEKFTQLMEILTAEATKFKTWFFSRHNDKGEMEIEMEIKR